MRTGIVEALDSFDPETDLGLAAKAVPSVPTQGKPAPAGTPVKR